MERVLLLSDCAGVVQQLEAAYRAASAHSLRTWERGAVLEAICTYRARLGSVVVVWVPSHEGVAPNAYADAVAKGSLDAPAEVGLTEGVAAHVWSRPCVYERDRGNGEGWELWDRPVFCGVRQQAAEWVRERLATTLRPGRITCGQTQPWPQLLAYVGRGDVPAPDEPPEPDPEAAAARAEQRNVATGLTMGVRADDVHGVRHGATWMRHRVAEGMVGGEYTRDGAHGCAACKAAQWERVGARERRRGRRRAARAPVVPLAALATANPFAALADVPVEQPVHLETLRHVITACKATGGNRAVATSMRRGCERVRAELAHEAGTAPATTCVQRAVDGWAAVEQGGRVTQPQWEAMHAMLGGALPTWVDSRSRPNEDRKRARAVYSEVSQMQDVLGERLRAHKRKAEPVVRWLKEREEGRGLMRGVFAAWAGARGSHNVPNTHLSHEDWKAWRAKETATQRDERRLREAVDRATSYGKLCWATFWKLRANNKRKLRIRLALLRRARAVVCAASRWGRVRGVVADALAHVAHAARRPKRLSAVLRDAFERARTTAAARPRDTVRAVPSPRTARVNLLLAATVGPVLTDMYIMAVPLGDG